MSPGMMFADSVVTVSAVTISHRPPIRDVATVSAVITHQGDSTFSFLSFRQ